MKWDWIEGVLKQQEKAKNGGGWAGHNKEERPNKTNQVKKRHVSSHRIPPHSSTPRQACAAEGREGKGRVARIHTPPTNQFRLPDVQTSNIAASNHFVPGLRGGAKGLAITWTWLLHDIENRALTKSARSSGQCIASFRILDRAETIRGEGQQSLLSLSPHNLHVISITLKLRASLEPSASCYQRIPCSLERYLTSPLIYAF